MFTPQRERGWPVTPSTGKGLRGSVFGKGKGVDSSDMPPPPPRTSLGENGGNAGGGSAEIEVWKRFREAGMLDEASRERKDREALLERIGKLESELYDYQHNMGLLLIEKKNWATYCEDLQRGITETQEVFKREQAANLIAISEMEKREENLRKALGVEKQCVADLEKAIREMQSKQSDTKSASDKKLAEANVLKENFEEKSLEIESKICYADAKLAEISRKSSEVERKAEELAARESSLQREQASLSREKELQTEVLAQQREELRAWEKALREGQERLLESQSLLNRREKRENETDKVLVKKEKDLEGLKETLERMNAAVKEKEDYINIRLTALATREKEIESQSADLRKKEQELVAVEERLNIRERVEIQKLVDDQKFILDSKMRDFEKEVEEKQKSLDEELRTKVTDLEKKGSQLKDKEKNLKEREQALESKTEKLKTNVEDLLVKSKALEKLETELKTKETELEEKNTRLREDNQRLLALQAELESERKAIEAEKVQLLSEQENLKVTEQERAEHAKLQLELKQEIEDCRTRKASLDREREELREDRKKFEREWEVLDEKRAALDLDVKQLNDEKEGLQKWKHNEELRLKSEQADTREEIKLGLDNLRLQKETFEETMAHERSELQEMLHRERADMAQELDLKKHELEIAMQKRIEELENQYHAKHAKLNEERTTELDRIESLRTLAASEMQKMKVEKSRFDREKQEYLTQREKLKKDQVEIQHDIDSLRSLGCSLKDRREEFIKEREQFLSLIEQHRTCKNCGVEVDGLAALSSLPVPEINGPGNAFSPTLASDYLGGRTLKKIDKDTLPGSGSGSGTSGGRMSWLKSCTKKIFNFSPGKQTDGDDEMQQERRQLFDTELGKEPTADDMNGRAETSQGFNMPVDDPSTLHEIEDNPIGTQKPNNGVADMVNEHNISSFDGPNETSNLSPLAEEGFETQEQPKKKVQRGRKKANPRVIKRTHSVQEVVKESEAFLNQASEKDKHEETRGPLLDNEIQEDSVHTDGKPTSVGQKRLFSHTSVTTASERDDDNSEAHSGSVSIGGRRKRRHVASESQPVPEKRYNFRRSTIEGTGLAVLGKGRGAKARSRSQSLANEKSKANLDEQEGTSKLDSSGASPLAEDNHKGAHMLQKCTSEDIVEVHEFSSQKILQESEKLHMDRNVEQGDLQKKVANGTESTSLAEEGQDEIYETEEDEDSSDDEEEDESDSEQHNASVGKKLWKFFTSG